MNLKGKNEYRMRKGTKLGGFMSVLMVWITAYLFIQFMVLMNTAEGDKISNK